MSRKAAVILYAAIILGAFVAFAPEPAFATNPHLRVSAENHTFDNYFSGAQIIEIVIIDPFIRETNSAKGEPTVTVNGADLRMNQATDGNWYAYFADYTRAQIADRTSDVRGTGLDFGTICSIDEAHRILGVLSKTNTRYFDGSGVALPRTIDIGIHNDCTSYDTSETRTQNVVRESKSINTRNNSIISMLSPRADTGDLWPFIQLYDFSVGGNAIIQYNRGGGTQSVTLTYNSVEHLARISLDRANYPNSAEVHFEITDTWLDIDPTDEDSWTWDVDGANQGNVYYHAFDAGGRFQNGITSYSDVSGSLGASLLCEDNCTLSLDRSVNGRNILEFQENKNSNVTLSSRDGGTPDGLITVTETGSSSGIFTSYDEGDSSVLVTSSDPHRGTTATINYNGTPTSILIDYAYAYIDIQPTDGDWVSGQEIPLILTDADANRNSRADEDLDVFNPAAIIPTLVTGNPLSIGYGLTMTSAEFTDVASAIAAKQVADATVAAAATGADRNGVVTAASNAASKVYADAFAIPMAITTEIEIRRINLLQEEEDRNRPNTRDTGQNNVNDDPIVDDPVVDDPVVDDPVVDDPVVDDPVVDDPVVDEPGTNDDPVDTTDDPVDTGDEPVVDEPGNVDDTETTNTDETGTNDDPVDTGTNEETGEGETGGDKETESDDMPPADETPSDTDESANTDETGIDEETASDDMPPADETPSDTDESVNTDETGIDEETASDDMPPADEKPADTVEMPDTGDASSVDETGNTDETADDTSDPVDETPIDTGADTTTENNGADTTAETSSDAEPVDTKSDTGDTINDDDADMPEPPADNPMPALAGILVWIVNGAAHVITTLAIPTADALSDVRMFDIVDVAAVIANTDIGRAIAATIANAASMSGSTQGTITNIATIAIANAANSANQVSAAASGANTGNATPDMIARAAVSSANGIILDTIGAPVSLDTRGEAFSRRGIVESETSQLVAFRDSRGAPLGSSVETVTALFGYDFRSLGIEPGEDDIDTIEIAEYALDGTSTRGLHSTTSLQGMFVIQDDTAVIIVDLGAHVSITPQDPIIADVMRFGFTGDGERPNQRVADQIIRLELEETGDNTGTFMGSLEYVMVNQLNIADPSTYEDIDAISDNVMLIATEELTDEDTLTVTYLDRGHNGALTHISDIEPTRSHTGRVSFDSANYKVGDTVTITLRDPDLNTSVDTIEVYTIPRDADYVGRTDGDVYTIPRPFGVLGRLLDVTFSDVRWEAYENTGCTVTNPGLRNQAFTLRETGTMTGVFEGDFQLPEQWCRPTRTDSNGIVTASQNAPVTGLGMEVNYVDYRDSSSAIIEVTSRAVIRTSTASVSLDRTVYPIPFGDGTDGSNFPTHETAGVSLAAHDLTVHIRITDPDFDTSASGRDYISRSVHRQVGQPDTINGMPNPVRHTNDPDDLTQFGPLKMIIKRGSAESVLGYAGGPVRIENRSIVHSTDPHPYAIEYGPIRESSDMGTFEFALNISWDDGPQSSECPNDGHCILQGDILRIEYTDSADSVGRQRTITDSAAFNLRDGLLRTDKTEYIIGSDVILTLVEQDFDLDGKSAETYTLNLIEWDGDDTRRTLGSGTFNPQPKELRETGKSTGIFQVVFEIPKYIERGELIHLEYTDWGPAGARYVGIDDHDARTSIHTADFGASINFDRAVYTWTDKVLITIIAPDYNYEIHTRDEIGATSNDSVHISTRAGDIENYRLIETGEDTGIFAGEITLSGFAHDADGRRQTGINGNDVSGAGPSGTGPTNGVIPAGSEDGISVSFEYKDDEYAVDSAPIHWNIGAAKWFEPSYAESSSGTASVTDPDMNWNPDTPDTFEATVYSDTDAGGLALSLTETGNASGIFEGTVLFTTDDRSSGQRLRVTDGDTVTLVYHDHTLPKPHSRADDMAIEATTVIGAFVFPLERAVIDTVSLTDNTGGALQEPALNQQFQVTGSVESGQQVAQEYVYIVQISNANDVTLSLTWTGGTLNAGQSIRPSVSWQPDMAGTYTATAFVWESIDNPVALSPQHTISFVVR